MKHLFPLLFLFQFAAIACFGEVGTPPPKKPLQAPQFTTLLTLIKAADLQDIFIGTGPFTIFAPSNAAFEKLGKRQLAELTKPQNKDLLIDLLTYHVIPGKYLSANLKTMDAQTINGKKIHITVDDGQIKANNANVTKKDLVGPNAVVYEIDAVLKPT